MPYKEINDLRKNGFLDEATAMAESEYAASPGKLEAIALFWCLNDYLQKSGYDREKDGTLEKLSRMKSLILEHDPDNHVTGKAMSVAENMLSGSADDIEGWRLYQQIRSTSVSLDERWKIIEEYAEIMSAQPSLLHSLMMAEAVKIEREASRGADFLKFVDKWNLDCLRADDWVQRDGKDSHRQSSLVEKIIFAYMSAVFCMEYAGQQVTVGEKLAALLDKAIRTFPSNLHLYRYLAHFQALNGSMDAAIDTICRTLCRAPEKDYLWIDLADMVTDLDLRIGMLCNAISYSKSDETALNQRLRLADCLCRKGYLPNALSELNKFHEVVQSHGWRLQKPYFELRHRIPYKTLPEDNALLYAEYGVIACEFVFSHLSKKLYVKVWELRGSQGSRGETSWLLRHDTEEMWIKPRKYRLGAKAHNGSTFMAYYSDERPGQIVSILPTIMSEPLPWLRTVTAPISIRRSEPDKVFGFIEGAYVPSSMLYGLADGALVSAIILRNSNSRWNALYLYK